MEVVNARAALLSNLEVLQLLQAQHAEQLAQAKAAFAVKKERDHNGAAAEVPLPTEQVCENLRTVEFEAIQYLSAPFQPTGRQSAEGTRALLGALRDYDLTKGEKLQIVNLAPTEPVELYVVVEELEERLLDNMDTVLQHVRDSLSDAASANGTLEPAPPPREATAAELRALAMEIDGGAAQDEEMWAEDEDEADYVPEGALEGDLDVEED